MKIKMSAEGATPAGGPGSASRGKTDKKTGFIKSVLSINQKIILMCLLVFIFGLGFGVKASAANDTHYATMNGSGTRDGSSLANAFGWAEVVRSENWDTDEDDDGKIGIGDTVYLYDDDGPFYGLIPIRQSGSSGKAITFTAPAGESPEIWGGMDGSTLSVGTPSELMTNTGFETGDKTGWTAVDSGSSVFTVETDNKHSGTYSLKVVRNGSSITLKQTVTVTPNTWYCITMWGIRTAGAGNGSIYIDDNKTIDGSNTRYLQDNLTTWAKTIELIDGAGVLDASWTQRGVVFRTGANQTTAVMSLYFGADVMVYVDDFSIKKIQWEQVSGNEYKLTPLFLSENNSYLNNQIYPRVAWYNGTPLTLGTIGALNNGEEAWDSTNNEFHVNVGGSPSGLDVKVPLFAGLIGSNSGSDYITINGITFKYAGHGEQADRGSIFTMTSQADNWTITNNTFLNNVRAIINGTSSAGDNWYIEGNSITNCWNGREYGGTGPSGIGINVYGDNHTITKNYIENAYCSIINRGCGTTIDRNMLNGVRVNGIWSNGNCRPPSDPTLIYNNSIYHNPPAGVGGHGIVLQDNTAPYGDSASGAIIRNNIVYASGGNAFCIASSPYVEEDNNLFYASGGAYVALLEYNGVLASTNYSTLADYKAAMASLKDNTTVYWTNSLGVTGTAAGVNDISTDPSWVDRANGIFTLQSISPAIDAVTDVSLTTDYAGNPIYGLPDIGGYEYQPTHTMVDSTNDPQIGETIRIYGDGKFRNTVDDSDDNDTDTAKLSIVPQDSETTKWLDLNISTWDTSGNYLKRWTENGDNLEVGEDITNTLHTVGDLEADKYYNVSVDGTLAESTITGADCTDGVCKSDEDGKITFTYTGGYTSHTFDVTEGDNTPPTVTNGTSPKFHTDTTSVTLSLTTDENSTCRYSTDQSYTYDDMTAFSTTGELNHSTTVTNLSPGDYTYYAICRDTVGNDTSYTLSFEIAPRKNDTGTADASLKNDQNNQTLDEDKKFYFDQDEGKLKGQDETVKNGTVKIYKEGKKYATVDVDSNGNWIKKITFSHNKTYTLKLKFYDQYGTLRDTKEYDVKVDTQKPTFTDPFPETLTIQKDEPINFPATDEDTGVDYYKIKLLDQKGHILRAWRKQDESFYLIPENVLDQAANIIVRAYDKAGNYAEEEANLKIGNNNESPNVPETSTSDSGEKYSADNINASPNTCSYTVESGDTLWGIAKEVYGDPTAYPLIIDKNKDQYPDIESILSIGQELVFGCENNQSQNTGNNSLPAGQAGNQQSQTQNQAQIQTSPKDNGFKWWNPFSWF